MATLDVTRNYSDGEVLTEAQLDLIRSDIEEFFNITKLDDNNIQNSGITASSKLANSSISSSKLGDSSIISAKIIDDAVTTSKIINEAVTPSKIPDNAVTAAKLTSLFLPSEEGAIRLFHTFNSTLDIPRGWMVLNGDVVNETNYNLIHGTGAYSDDGVAASNLLNKNLPNFSTYFSVGNNSTTQDGSSAITRVGNTDHEIDLDHTHTLPSHTHDQDEGAALTSDMQDNQPGAYTEYQEPRLTSLANTATMSDSGQTTISVKPEAIPFVFIIRVI